MIGHSSVSSWLYYANALLHGTSVYNINRLQVAQNLLVRTVCQAPQSASATKLRCQLHWLPVRQRISYKVAVITYKTCSTSKLAYLSDLLQDYRPARTKRSSDKLLLSTVDGISVLGESLQHQRPFSLELAVISVSIC